MLAGFADSAGGILAAPFLKFVNSIADAALAMLQFFLYDGTFAVNYANFFANPTELFLIPRSTPFINAMLKAYDVDADGMEADIQINSEDINSSNLIELLANNGILSVLFGTTNTGNTMSYVIPAIKYTPEAIFGNQVPALDINFINPKDWEDDNMNNKSIASALHDTIASWYVALRNLAIVILLSVLLYVGIRMVISSTSSDKAKYKQMLFDWLVALTILFFLHYVMSFILTMTSIIVDGIYDSSAEIVVEVQEDSDSIFHQLGEAVGGAVGGIIGTNDDSNDTSESSNGIKFRTNLTGLVRFQVQYSSFTSSVIFTIFYVAMVIYTWLFTWTYIKRAITVAFLTLMAPLIAITYPIDKISDGKAQAFGVWFREFVFNALLQPFHLIIYTIFLGGATKIAVTNPIYAILVLAFMTPAEKLLRRMFGFEKASTAGTLSAAGMFGGAAAFKMFSSAVNSVAKAGSKSKSGGGSNKDSKVRVKAKNDATKGLKAFAESGQNGGGNSSQQGGSGSPRQGNRNSNSETDPAKRAALQKYENEGGERNANGWYFNPYIDDYDPNYNPLNDTAYYNPQLSQTTIDRTERMNAGGSQDINVNRQAANNVPPPSAPVIPANYTRQVNGADGRSRTSIRTMANRTRQLLSQTEEGREARREFINNPKNRARLAVARKVLGGTAKVAGRVALGAIGGGIGLAAGIASDDLDDVLKYGAAGAALGAMGLPAVGKGIASSAQNMAGDLRYTYNKEVYGPTQAALMEQTREYKNNEKNIDLAREYFRDNNEGREPTKEELDQTLDVAAEYYNEGIDEDKIFKAIDLEKTIQHELATSGVNEEELIQKARARAKTIAKMAQDPELTKEKLMDSAKRNNIIHSWEQEFVNKHQMGRREAEIQAKNVMSKVMKFKGLYIED